MYFANDEHKQNFSVLSILYLHVGNDTQYGAHNYIAAYPEIFKCFDLDQLDTSSGPLYSIMEWNEEKENYVFNHPALTGSTTQLAKVGLSLYNGYEIELDNVFGSIANDEMFNVFIQACKIRAKK